MTNALTAQRTQSVLLLEDYNRISHKKRGTHIGW